MEKIFISYRRNGGDAWAEKLYYALKKKRYSVFYDYVSIGESENYNDRIEKAIRECEDFVILLTPGALDKCTSDPNDWVAREIKTALEAGKNVIPILIRGFSFPEGLPEDIAPIVYKNGIPCENIIYFDAMVTKLTAYFTKKKTRRFRKSLDGLLTIPRGLKKAFHFILGLFARFISLRIIAASVLIGMLIVSGTEITEFFDPSLPRQWIDYRPLYKDCNYLNNMGVSDDGTLYALYDGSGKITINQIRSGSEGVYEYRTLETSFKNQAISVAFSDDLSGFFVFCGNEVEIFNLISGEKEGIYKPEKPHPDATDATITNLFTADYQERFMVFWDWYDSDGKARSSLGAYKLDGDKYVPISERSVLSTDGLSPKGCDGNAEYYLFIDEETVLPCIADLKNMEMIRDEKRVQSIMKDNLSGNIPSYDRTLFNEEQSLIIYPDFADVDTGSFLSAEFWIFDMNTGERRTLGIFNKVAFWTFADNDTLVVLHEKTLKDQTCETVLERIDIKNKDSKEILLNEKELIRILGKDSDGNPPIYRPTWTYFFEEDETKSFLMFDGKIRIVDYEKKRLVTTSNRLYADFPEGLPEDGDWEYICGCNLWRSDTSFTLLAYTAVPEYDKISQTLGARWESAYMPLTSKKS